MRTASTAPSTVPSAAPVRALLAAAMVLLLALTTALSSATAAADAQQDAPSNIDARLLAAARSDDSPLRVVLVLSATPDRARVAGGRKRVTAELRRVARDSQSAVVGRLSRQPDRFGKPRVLSTFWLQNMIFVEFDGKPAHLDALARVPGVDRVIPNFATKLIEDEPLGTTAAPFQATVDDATWGVAKIGADRAQDELGVDGTGVRVAVLDSGVDAEHPDIAGKLATDDPADPTHPGGWMSWDRDGNAIASTPNDPNAHGTHVSGTVVGGAASGHRIGVAPGATLMVGQVLDASGSGSWLQAIAAMQWAIAPFDAEGNPAGEPADVINMSLGPKEGNVYVSELIAPSRNAHLAGTTLVAASGNCGRDCLGSPANIYGNLAVGNTTPDDDVNSGSSGGVAEKAKFVDPPADWPDSWIVPDVSAPGTDVLSSWPGGGWETISGTSMAAPHVAGTVALMLQARPDLTPAQVRAQLEKTSVHDGRYGPETPNTRIGHGRIDAFAAVSAVAMPSGIGGSVTDASTGSPLAGVRVVNRTTGAGTTTGADGRYRLFEQPGTYEIAVELFGYGSVEHTVEIAENAVTAHDVGLEMRPRGRISGEVVLAASGHGVPGSAVMLTGTPLSTTTGADGRFTFAGVPAGSYQVTTGKAGLRAPAPVSVTVDQDATASVSLDVERLPRVGVLGDSPDRSAGVETFLDKAGVPAESIGWDTDVSEFDTIVVNVPGDPGEQRFTGFLAATDRAGVGVVFLDAANTGGSGISLVHQYLGNPAAREFASGTGTGAVGYQVVGEHPVLAGFSPGDQIPLDDSSPTREHAWFQGYGGEGRTVLANVTTSGGGTVGAGIGVHQRANNRHVLLSLNGASAAVNPPGWRPEGARVFDNAVRWAARVPDENEPVFVPWHLTVDQDSVLHGKPVTISATVTNVGRDAGDYTARLAVDGEPEALTADVHLAGGESTTVRWQVSREQLGTYRVTLADLTTSFGVRTPRVDLAVSTVDGAGVPAGPLAGAQVHVTRAQGEMLGVGTTDAHGMATFSSPVVAGEYQIVVRRPATETHPFAYLLTRRVRVDDDLTLKLMPATGDAGTRAAAADRAATVALRSDSAGTQHSSVTYLRNEMTAGFAFGFDPGRVVVSTGDYEVRHVHRAAATERDTWGLSEIRTVSFGSATEQTLAYGGPAAATLSATLSPGGTLTGRWSVTDAHGNPFALFARTELRPLASIAAITLEDLPRVVAGAAPETTEVVLRVHDRKGKQVAGTGLRWPGGEFTATVPGVDRRGRYDVTLTAGLDAYAPGTLTSTLQVRPE